MQERYIAFDVETPNCRNDRISAIGVTVVDPECSFDPFNVSLTGITPEMVADKPTFPELWQELGPCWTADCWWPTTRPLTCRCWPSACGTMGSSGRSTRPLCLYLPDEPPPAAAAAQP